MGQANPSHRRVDSFKELTRENYVLVLHSIYSSLYALLAIANTSSHAEASTTLRLMGIVALLGTPIMLAHFVFCVLSMEAHWIPPWVEKREPSAVFGVLLVRDAALIFLSFFAPTLSFSLVLLQGIPLLALSSVGFLKTAF